jgi:hypothetical protein
MVMADEDGNKFIGFLHLCLAGCRKPDLVCEVMHNKGTLCGALMDFTGASYALDDDIEGVDDEG